MPYYVMRTHSQTDRQTLWKLMSRPIEDKAVAEGELEWHKLCEKNKKHNFFLVQMDESATPIHKMITNKKGY